MVLFLIVVIILTLSIAQTLQTRLFNFGGRRQQDAPETLPG